MESETKRYRVQVNVEWVVEVEAANEEEAEYEAADIVQGPYTWGKSPDYEDYYAEEI